jgi:hypothetical protein
MLQILKMQARFLQRCGLVIGLLGAFFIAKGQQNDLVLQVSHTNGNLELKWYPLNAAIWEQLNETGYALERYEIDASGNVRPNSKVQLAGGSPTTVIFPKDSLWFAEHASEQNYYIDALGSLLYDPDFQYESDLLDASAVKYNYLMREAVYPDNTAAKALGLYFQDSTMVDGLLYRYVLSATQNGKTIAQAQVDMNAESGIWVSQEVDLTFDIPDGKSITEMSGRLSNVSIDFVRITAKAYEDSLVLRWGPNSPDFWSAANQKGYTLMKMWRLANGEMVIDSIGLIKPWAKEEIDESIAHDDMALVAAQVLYGEMDKLPENIYEQASLYANRHAFALYAAERSKLAGDILGLRFVDKLVEPGEKYTYFINSSASTFAMSGHSVEIENKYIPDPVPVDFKAAPLDSAILLTWNKEQNKQYFSSYFVERSDDGGQSFQQIHEDPLVFLDDDEFPTEFYTYSDSVGTNEKAFIYRLRGLTAFADKSPYAEAQSQGRDLLPPAPPSFYYSELLDDTLTIELKWRMASYPDDFAGFKVLLGEGTEGDFDTISNLLPAADSVKFTYTVEKYTERLHFFKILAFDINGNAGESITRYVHYPDLVPPLPPENLVGTIDENGILTLVWDHSLSKDVTGYWVYYGHDSSDLFVPAFDFPIDVNTFKDTIPMVSMNERIYYYVLAQDDNYNKSEIGDIIEIERPDNVPPLAPFLNHPIATDSAIILSWTKSGSDDVIAYELLKRPYNEAAEWVVIDTILQDSNRVYFDTDCEFEQQYEYSIRVQDDANLYSPNAHPFSASLLYDFNKIQVNEFTITYDEEKKLMNLDWTFNPPSRYPPGAGDYLFYLYKSYGGEPVEALIRLDKDTVKYEDREIEQGALHNYGIMVVFDSGASSALSEVKSVLIEE